MGVGGIAEPLARVAEKFVPEEALAKAGEWGLGSMERYFQPDHPKWGAQDAALLEQAHEFGRQGQVHMAGINKDYKAVRATIDSFPDLKDKHGPGKPSTLQDIHTDLQNHPDPAARATAQHSASLMARHPTNPARTLQEISNRSPYTARKDADISVFGNNHANLNPHFYEILQMGRTDPEALQHADALADVFSHLTHDKVPIDMGDIKQADISRTKKDINKWVRATNIFKPDPQKAVPLTNTEAVYSPPTSFERKANSFTYRVVAPWIVWPHLGQTVNLSADIFRNLGKTVLSLSDKNFREALTNYGITAATQHSILNEAINWEQGKVGQVIGSKPAAILGKFLYNPGFHPMRYSQLMLGGAVGYHALERMGEDAVAGDAGAIENLRRLHIDPQAVIARGGKLEEAEFAKGVYHFVNDRFFIDKTLQRSLRSSSNFYLRNMAMFKTFVTYQSSFIGRELSRLIKTRDYVGFAHYVGLMGIAFPFVAPLIKSAETLTRTWDLDKTEQGLKSDYRALNPFSDATAMQRISKYGELMSYLGAWGMFHSFWKAAEGHRLAESSGLLGGHPLIGAALEEMQDIYTGAKGTKRGEHHWQPALRQALRYTIPAIGGPIGQKFFPTPGARRRKEDDE